MSVAEAETIVSAIFPGTSAAEKKTLVDLLVELEHHFVLLFLYTTFQLHWPNRHW